MTLGGDLLNQIMAASTAAQKLQTPFLGIYGACSTMAETLCIGAMLCDGGYARRALRCWTHRRAARFAARRTSPWGALSIWRLRT